MKNLIIKSSKILFLAFLFPIFSYGFEVKNIAQAVDISGKQRMFTQKMLRDYGMIGLELKFGNPKDDLKKIMKEFEEHLDALDKFNRDPKIKKSLAKERKLWLKMKKILQETPSKEKALDLHEDLHKLLKVADETTKLFDSKAGAKSGHIINIAGRQRMLSQRIAALYMMRVWGLQDKDIEEHMSESMKIFQDSLKELQSSSLNNKEINKLLAKVKKDFSFFEIMSRSKTKFIPSLIYQKSNDILRDMDKVTKLYTSEKIQ